MDGDEPVPLVVKGYRQLLTSGQNAYGSVNRILEETDGFPQTARASILRNGYLYAERPELAYALVSLVQPHQLFGHDRIWIERGEQVLHAERRNGKFYYVDGPLEGEKVRVKRQTEAGYDIIEAPLPAVLSVSDAINEPRYPSLKAIMGAKRKPQETLSAADLQVSGEPRTEVLELSSPPAKAGCWRAKEQVDASPAPSRTGGSPC